LGFPTSYEMWRNIVVLTVEGQMDNYSFAARCYLKVIMGGVEAVITGGTTRRAQRNQVLWLNGSRSQDLSKRSTDTQFSTYHWSCHSFDDKDNLICRQNISKDAVFSIPEFSFKRECRYDFTLKVSRDDDPKVTSQKYQSITMTDSKVLDITIECVWNCQMDLVSPSSDVQLRAKCTNCFGKNLKYKWYVGRKKPLTSKLLAMYLGSASNKTQINLVVSAADGSFGRDVRTLIRNPGPSQGKCFVSPTEGQEALTPFIPCCQNFFTLNNPIEYWYYAGPVFLDSCFDCSCAVHLPITKYIKVLVCDVVLVCRPSWISVNVTALDNIPVHPPMELWKYITNPPYNILNLLEEGLFLRYFQTIQSMADRVHEVDSAIVLLSSLKGYTSYSRGSLGKLANLTLTLARRLQPFNMKKQAVLTYVVRKINNNFQEIFENDNIMSILAEKPLIKTTLACLKVYDIMKKLSNITPPPPSPIYRLYRTARLAGKLDQKLIDHLAIEIKKLSNGPMAVEWLSWLNTTWETDRLHGYLGYSRRRDFRAHLDDHDVVIQNFYPSISLSVVCVVAVPHKTFHIDTADGYQTVYFTPEFLEEFWETDEIPLCIKVISVKRRLKWWYPTERMPSFVLLSVRIFQYNDSFTQEVHLRQSTISFRQVLPEIIEFEALVDEPLAKIGKQVPMSERKEEGHLSHTVDKAGIYMNLMQKVTLKNLKDVRIYRTLLNKHTMLAVHFVSTTHPLQVMVTLEKQPLFSQLSKSSCFIPVSNQCKVVLLRNNCRKAMRAYVAVQTVHNVTVVAGEATFAFAFQLRFCEYWVYSMPPDKQHWRHYHCIPSMDKNVKMGLICSCKMLSTYTAYTHFIPPVLIPINPFLEIKLNYILIAAYIIVLALLIPWLIWLINNRNQLPNRAVFHRLVDLDDKAIKTRKVHDLWVLIKTGGFINSETTASIRITFQSRYGHRINMTQDPEHIRFKRNTTNTLWLKTRDIRIPTKLFISHNNNGRFPSWFLRRIEIDDIQTGESQVFIARRWITRNHGIVLQSELIFKRGDSRFIGTRRRRFALIFEMLWNNWSLWHPITAGWRDTNHYPNISRAKRVCIFISKILVTFTICICYFGLTTEESLQLIRNQIIALEDVIKLSLICGITETILQSLMEQIIRRFG
ncbi:hypothetical protein KR067_006339, partial [Drosophila pandora]